MQEAIAIATPDHIELEFDLAGLGSRFAAHVIDLLCIYGIFLSLILVAVITLGLGSLVSMQDILEQWAISWVVAGFIVLLFLLQWGYFVLFEGLWRGQTPGKRCLGIRVLRDTGLPITWRDAALRNLVRTADMLPPPSYLLAGVVMYFDRHGRRLGDMAAGTLVVREHFATEAGPTSRHAWGATWLARLETGTARQLTLPQGTISAAQLTLIEQFLQRRHTLPVDRRLALARQILTPLLPLLGDAQPVAGREEEVLRDLLALAERTTTGAVSGASEHHYGEDKQRQWAHFWQRARTLLQGRRRALQALSPADFTAFLSDYRRLTADLARGRSLGADPHTLAYLNRLLVMGHNVLYGYVPRSVRSSPYPWWTLFPRAVRAHRWAVVLAAGSFLLPAAISYVTVQWYPELAYDLVADDFFDFMPSDTEHLHRIPSLFRPIAATAIITNNVQVTLLAFGLGLTAGLGTLVILAFNGVYLGAVASWLALQGHGYALWGWIMPHGGTEIVAIILSGSAGLLLAQAILAPGTVRRATALKRVAPQALQIELGCMAMLLIAGLIEGFISPSSIGYPARIAVLVASLCGWAVYLTWAGANNSASS
jgi:uncharacterized membrane protein SpoIIM required for sporulation/uncharacterized RDD family membrane protein YckC